MTAIDTTMVDRNDPYAAADRLMKARCRLMTKEPWYGHIALKMSYKPSQMEWAAKPQRTMAVRFSSNADQNIECIFYPEFVMSRSIEQLYATIQHEIEHIVRLHLTRASAYVNDHAHARIWNYATDMTINGKKGNPRIGYPDDNNSSKKILPFDDIVFIPDDWVEDGTAEQYYNKLMEKHQKMMQKVNRQQCQSCKGSGGQQQDPGGQGQDQQDQGGGGQDQQDQNSQGGQGQQQKECPSCGSKDTCGSCGKCGSCGEGGQSGSGGEMSMDDLDKMLARELGHQFDDHQHWNEGDMCEDEARQLVKAYVGEACSRNPGSVPGHLKGVIEELQKPVVRWYDILRRFLGRHCGGRRLTWARRNRRIRKFGYKGVSHRAVAKLSLIVDTSGSISDRLLEQFFAEIEQISHHTEVSVLQWDHGFQGFWPKYRKGDWKKIEIGGRGGTDMAAPIEWLVENGLVGDAMIMLTDGEVSGYGPDQDFPFVCLIGNTNFEHVREPEWGESIKVDTTTMRMVD